MRIISVFDDLKYDRADADILSVGMRKHAIKVLSAYGFKQSSGTVLRHGARDIKCIMPKFHALGASPFDAVRHTPKREKDYYILTPTQTACQFVDYYSTDVAVERIKKLITRQPINVLRLFDFLERTKKHQAFVDAIGHLKYVQRKAIESEPLRRMKALG